MAEWLQRMAKEKGPAASRVWFIELAFQGESAPFSTPTAVTVRFEFRLGGPPFPDVVEIEIERFAWLRATTLKFNPRSDWRCMSELG